MDLGHFNDKSKLFRRGANLDDYEHLIQTARYQLQVPKTRRCTVCSVIEKMMENYNKMDRLSSMMKVMYLL
jgi:hypothetical protein